MNRILILIVAISGIIFVRPKCQIVKIIREKSQKEIASEVLNINTAFKTLKRSGDTVFFDEVRDPTYYEAGKIIISDIAKDIKVSEDDISTQSITKDSSFNGFVVHVHQSKKPKTEEYVMFGFKIWKIKIAIGDQEPIINKLVKEISPFKIEPELEDDEVIKRIQDKLRNVFPYTKSKEELEAEENIAWDEAVSINTIESHKSFMESYPYGQYIETAQQKIKEIEAQEIADKNKKIAEENKKIEEECDNWNRAISMERKDEFKKFIALYPKSENIATAKYNIKQLNLRLGYKIGMGVVVGSGVIYAFLGKKNAFNDAKELYEKYSTNRSPDSFEAACPECGTRSEAFDRAESLRKERENAIITGTAVAVGGAILFYLDKEIFKLKKSKCAFGISENGMSLTYKF